MLGLQTSAYVILPQRKPGDNTPFKTLYLLHGMSDDESMWSRRTRIESYADAAGIAVVMPTTHLGWYTNMKSGWAKYFSYIADELPGIMRSFFAGMSPAREDNFVAGLSMGGYGALKVALARPERFAGAGVFSAAFDVAARTEFRPNSEYWVNIFGSSPKGGEDDLYAAAERLKAGGGELPDIYMWCGTEDSLIKENRRMRDRLAALGYPLTYRESEGTHDWRWWDEQAKIFIAEHM
jgi:putative tributyrin esterase